MAAVGFSRANGVGEGLGGLLVVMQSQPLIGSGDPNRRLGLDRWHSYLNRTKYAITLLIDVITCIFINIITN